MTIDGEEKLLCGWHAQVWEAHHVLKPPPRKRKRSSPSTPMRSWRRSRSTFRSSRSRPREATVAATNGSEPRTLRERVEDTTDALYEDIERGLREALTNATKARKTRCPSCQEAFEVRLPDHGASISAAKALLDLVVSRPKPEIEPGLAEYGSDGFDLDGLSTEQLRRYPL